MAMAMAMAMAMVLAVAMAMTMTMYMANVLFVILDPGNAGQCQQVILSGNADIAATRAQRWAEPRGSLLWSLLATK